MVNRRCPSERAPLAHIRTKHPVWPLLALWLSGAAGAPAARAADPPARSEKTRQRAKQLFERAETTYRLGKFADALALYKQVLALERRPSVVFNIAQCHRQLAHFDKAIFYYKLYLSEWVLQNGKAPPNQSEVRARITELRAAKQRAEAQREKREAERRRAEQRERRLQEQLARTAKRTSGPAGRIRVVGLEIDDARVMVDGMVRAVSPVIEPIAVEPGKHRVRIKADGYLPWVRRVEVVEDEPLDLHVTLRLAPHKSRWWLASTVTSFALAAGAEALAIGFTLRANSFYRDTPPFDEARSVAIAGHVGAAVLGAFAVTSLVLYLRSGRQRQSGDTAAYNGGVVPLRGGAAALGRVRF